MLLGMSSTPAAGPDLPAPVAGPVPSGVAGASKAPIVVAPPAAAVAQVAGFGPLSSAGTISIGNVPQLPRPTPPAPSSSSAGSAPAVAGAAVVHPALITDSLPEPTPALSAVKVAVPQPALGVAGSPICQTCPAPAAPLAQVIAAPAAVAGVTMPTMPWWVWLVLAAGVAFIAGRAS